MTRGGSLGTRTAAVAFLVVALMVARARPAGAEDGDAGRRYYKQGQEFLKVGDYRSAAAAFQAGYAAAPRVGFLLNIGNCYRKLGELGKAREYYWRFLDAAPKNHSSRTEVTDYLRAMEQMEADGVPLDGSSVPSRPVPPREATAVAPIAPGAVSAEPAPPGVPAFRPSSPSEDSGPGMVVVDLGLAPAAAPPPEPERKPLIKKWWFWTLIGGAVVAGGVAAFALSQRSSGPSCSATLGCAHE